MGIKIEKYENGKVYLSQPCLIEKFLKASGMIDYNPNTTPSAVEPLGLGNTSNPKKIHAAAVKPIRRCLKGTKDKGMILDPSNKYEIDCYM